MAQEERMQGIETRLLMRRKGWVVLLALAALAVLLPKAVWGSGQPRLVVPLVKPDPDYREIGLGSTATIAIAAYDFTDLFGVQLKLNFDPSKLQVIDADPVVSGIQVALGDILSGLNWYILENTVDNTAGEITVIASLTGVATGYNGSGALINITFMGAATGTSGLGFAELVCSDHNGLGIAANGQSGTIVVLNGATLTPTYTPTRTRTPTRTPTPVVTPTHTPIAPASMSISPSHRQVTISNTTTVDILIANAANLYGAEVHIAFDPTIVQVVDADDGATDVQIGVGVFPHPDYVPVNIVNNTEGTIDFAMTQIPPRAAVNGSGVLATITFLAMQGGVSPVTIIMGDISNPDGHRLPLTTYDGEIEVLSLGTLVGQVSFQGRASPPSVSWTCPLSVTLYEPGAASPAYTFAALSDNRGVFTVTNILTGTYHVKVRDLHSLWSVRHNVPLAMGAATANLGTLVEGDADANGVIDILDFSILATAFGKAPPDVAFDQRADFNNSFNIDILDFSLLATNYGRSGEVVATAAEASQRPAENKR